MTGMEFGTMQISSPPIPDILLNRVFKRVADVVREYFLINKVVNLFKKKIFAVG